MICPKCQQARIYWVVFAMCGNCIRAAIADTRPQGGDVKQAPFTSGGGAGTAIAQEPSA